jgi:hypothetical protein
MAKTIIKPGTNKFHARCDQCGCRFDYEREDVRHDYVHSRDVVSCPSCGHSLVHLGASGTRWPWDMEIAGGRRGDWFKAPSLRH